MNKWFWLTVFVGVFCLTDAKSSDAWTLTIDDITCQDVLNITINCALPTVVNRTFSYTIRNEANVIVKSGTMTLPNKLSNEAVRNSLDYALHMQKYPNPIMIPGIGTVISK